MANIFLIKLSHLYHLFVLLYLEATTPSSLRIPGGQEESTLGTTRLSVEGGGEAAAGGGRDVESLLHQAPPNNHERLQVFILLDIIK